MNAPDRQGTGARRSTRRRVLFGSSFLAASFTLGSASLISLEAIGGSGVDVTVLGVTLLKIDRHVEQHETKLDQRKIIQIFRLPREPRTVRVEPKVKKKAVPTPVSRKPHRQPAALVKYEPPADVTPIQEKPSPTRRLSTPASWDVPVEALEIETVVSSSSEVLVETTSTEVGTSGSGNASGTSTTTVSTSGSSSSASSVSVSSTSGSSVVINGNASSVSVTGSGDGTIVVATEVTIP